MAASFCHSITVPLRPSSSCQMSILSCSSSSGGVCLRQNHSGRISPRSRARLRAFQPCLLLGSSKKVGKRSVRCGAVITIVQSEFAGEVLGSDVPVLVDFVADWCGPCRLISPIIEWASQAPQQAPSSFGSSKSYSASSYSSPQAATPQAPTPLRKLLLGRFECCKIPHHEFPLMRSKEYNGRLKVVKIDHDANPKLIEEYKVYGLPTLILFKNGQEVPESRREGVITKIKLKDYLDSLLGSAKVV